MRAQALTRHKARHAARSLATKANPSRNDRTMRLSDGRTLGYSDLGDPKGHPLLYFHGWPGSRLRENWSFHQYAKQSGVRLISPDRPGFGLSTFQPRRTMLDYPADVIQLADSLGLRRFGVLGHSGGGPYAVVCAGMLPRSRLAGVGLLAPSNPPPSMLMEEEWRRRVHARARRYALAMNFLFSLLEWRLIKGNDEWLRRLLNDYYDGKDMSLRQRVPALFRFPSEDADAWAQGADGPLHDWYLRSAPWGFDLGRVDYGAPIHIWHGYQDSNCGVEGSMVMASALPRAVLIEHDGDHFYPNRTMMINAFKLLTGQRPTRDTRWSR